MPPGAVAAPMLEGSTMLSEPLLWPLATVATLGSSRPRDDSGCISRGGTPGAPLSAGEALGRRPPGWQAQGITPARVREPEGHCAHARAYPVRLSADSLAPPHPPTRHLSAHSRTDLLTRTSCSRARGATVRMRRHPRVHTCTPGTRGASLLLRDPDPPGACTRHAAHVS